MTTLSLKRTNIPLWAAFVLGVISLTIANGATPPPDPCKLVTVAEIEAITGPLQGPPVPGGAGEVSCEFTPVKGPRWIDVRLHDGELSDWKKRNGGPKPVATPEFGKDAFMNLDADGTVELYAKKGNFVLRVSMPIDPAAVSMVKAIAKKALARM